MALKHHKKDVPSAFNVILLWIGMILLVMGLTRAVSSEFSGNPINDSLQSSLGRRNQTSMTCKPIPSSDSWKSRTPLIVFAMGRTGSSLFMDLIRRVSNHPDNRAETDLLSLNALFTNSSSSDGAFHSFTVARALANSCQDLEQLRGSFLLGSWKEWRVRQQTEQAMEFLQTQAQGEPILSRWLELHQNKRSRAVEVLEFVSNIPSHSPKPVVALKIFHDQLPSRQSFISQIMTKARSSSINIPTIIILWRRRMIESFVSRAIGRKTKRFIRDDTGDQVVEVKKDELETFLEAKKKQYTSIRDQLNALQVPYQVFEYNRDLLDEGSKVETIQRLQRLLNLHHSRTAAQDILPEISVRKQSSVPLSHQVSNWDEVASWGYGGESNEWEDLFAS